MLRPADVFLSPGEMCFSGADIRIGTMLGSCVSVTVWHPRLRIGGMCHYMVPTRGRRRNGRGPDGFDRPPALDGRYADEAVRMLVAEMARYHTRPVEYDTMMFGGGNQFPDAPNAGALDVARDNVAIGLRLLERYGFRLTTTHLGGTGYRRLLLDVSTGGVSLTHLDQLVLESVA